MGEGQGFLWGGPKGANHFLPSWDPHQIAHGGSPPRHYPFLSLLLSVSCMGARGLRAETAPSPLTLGQWGVDGSLGPRTPAGSRSSVQPAGRALPHLLPSYPHREMRGRGWHQPWTAGRGDSAATGWGPGRWLRGEGRHGSPLAVAGAGHGSTRHRGPAPSCLWGLVSSSSEKQVGPPHRGGSASRGTVPWNRGH